jgi:hypothetical protein
MQLWLEIFSLVAAAALIVQVVILTLLFFQLRRTTENMNRLFAFASRPDFDARANSFG